MFLQALLIFRLTKEPIKLVSIFSLPSLWLFQKSNTEEIIIFIGRTIVSRISHLPSQIIEEQGYRCFVYRNGDLACIAVTSSDYSTFMCSTFLHESFRIFVEAYPHWDEITVENNLTCPDLTSLLAKYQHPEKANVLTKINDDLNETKDIMIKNIDSLLNRGEKIEDLLIKSENLSKESKDFLIKTKKLNRCCVII